MAVSCVSIKQKTQICPKSGIIALFESLCFITPEAAEAGRNLQQKSRYQTSGQ